MSLELKKLVDGGTLGAPVVVMADLSGDFDIKSQLFHVEWHGMLTYR